MCFDAVDDIGVATPGYFRLSLVEAANLLVYLVVAGVGQGFCASSLNVVSLMEVLYFRARSRWSLACFFLWLIAVCSFIYC